MNLLGESQTRERIFKIPFAMHPAQKVINDHPARFKIVRAGRKFGKTALARKKALDWLGPPDSTVWYIGPTYKQTKLITWGSFKKLIPQEALKRKPNDTDLIITLKNGSELYLMGGDDPDSLKGPEPSAVIFEEAALMKQEIWHEVIRPNLAPKRAPAMFITTPKGFNWFKDLEDNARNEIANGSDRWGIFHYTIYDNPYISPAEIAEAKADCAGNDRYWRQEYLAEYEASVGRVFSSFNEGRHVGSVPRTLGPAGRAIDWGMRDDTGCVWGYVQNRTLYVYREHAESDLPASAQAAIIVGRTDSSERIERNIISHDATRMDAQMRGLTVMWHFQNAGIRPLKPSSKNKDGSRSLLQQLFREDRILIDRSCTKLRKQLLAYEWKDTILEQTTDVNVDLVDALHYLAELYQVDLAMPAHAALSVPEQIRQAKEEMRKKQQEMQRFALPNKENESTYEFSGSGGYL